MKTSAVPLLPLLRSRTQGELLALLYLHPDTDYSLTDAARLLGSNPATIHHEINRLADSGLVISSRRGNMRLVRAADTILTGPLTDLLALTYGPLPVLADVLAGVPGIGQAFIYGSWAGRYSGEPGPPPADVDVLVIGTADVDDLDTAAQVAESTLRRPVNMRHVSAEQWADPNLHDPFLDDVKSKPLVAVEVSE